MQPLVFGIASIDGGRAANVVAQTVTLRGTIRWFDQADRDRAIERADEIAAGVCAALRVHHELRVTCSVPVLHCAQAPIDLLARAATAAGMTTLDAGPLPVSEDFAFVAQRVPTGFVLVGAGGEGYGAHHAPDFDIDEDAIGLIAETLARAALDRLGS
jgi:amidohydrolase